jgi:hypothetical protein
MARKLHGRESMSLLASLSPAYRQSLASKKAGTDGDRPLSPYAEMIDTLQSLKKNDPDLYKRVRQETVTCLQTAAQTADAALDIRTLVARRRRF